MKTSLLLTTAPLTLLLTASLTAQTSASLVVPDLTQTDGIANASSGQPWWATTTSVRTQQLYGSADFPYQTPLTITRIRFRPRDYTPSSVSWTGGTYQMQIRMSTSPLTPATMTATYASNHGANELLVHNGPVALLPGSGNAPGPSAPYVDLTLATPFTYDPSQGSLVVDFLSDGALYTGGTAYFPAVDRYGQANAARVWHTGNTTQTTGIYENYSGLVMDFDFTFTGTFADFYADELGAAVGTAMQFTDRSITSAAGGITSWQWDFDGDNVVDSTQQSPLHTFHAPGNYDVSLTVASASGQHTKTKMGYVVVGAPTGSVPDLIQYQFNEVRGNTVANTASGTTFPSIGTVSNTDWQQETGAGRETFRGNEAGFGSLGIRGVQDENWIDTGAPLNHNGSISVSWWQRMDPSAPSNAWAYAFGGPGGTFTAYNRGGAYSSIAYIGTAATGDLLCLKDIHHPNWVHLCLVVDDAAGTVTWYVDGLPAGTKSYPANTNSIALSQFLVGKNDTSPTHARYYATDDFRLYGRALSYGEVLGTMQEGASAAHFGQGCAIAGPISQIDAVGRPALGNSAFAVDFANPLYANGIVALVGGLQAHANLPVSVAPHLGCGDLWVSIDMTVFGVTDGSGNASRTVSIPANPAFTGLHLYLQYLSLIGTTDALDCNVQTH